MTNEDRTHTFSFTARCAVHYTIVTIGAGKESRTPRSSAWKAAGGPFTCLPAKLDAFLTDCCSTTKLLLDRRLESNQRSQFGLSFKLLLASKKLGAGEEVRTLDIYLGKVMLYQLSYARIVTIYMASRDGLEPPTFGFGDRCSAN